MFLMGACRIHDDIGYFKLNPAIHLSCVRELQVSPYTLDLHDKTGQCLHSHTNISVQALAISMNPKQGTIS